MKKENLFYNKKYKTKEINDILTEITYFFQDEGYGVEAEIENKLKENRKKAKTTKDTKALLKDVKTLLGVLQKEFKSAKDKEAAEEISYIFCESILTIVKLKYLEKTTVYKIIDANANLLDTYGKEKIEWAQRAYK